MTGALSKEMPAYDLTEIEPHQRPSFGFAKRLAAWLDIVVFAGLLGLIVLAIIPYGLVDAWWEAIFECAVFVLTAIWILEALLREDWQVRRLLLLLPLILMTVYAFAQTVVWPGTWLPTATRMLTAQHTLSIDRYQTYLTTIKILSLTLFFGLLILHSATPARFRWLVRVVIGVGVASALFGILRQFLQASDSQTGFVLPFLFYGRGYGQFISQTLFAYLMEMPFGLLLGLLLGGGVGRDRILIYLALIIPVWAALVLSNSRGGIVSLTIQSIFLLFVAMNWYSARRSARDDGKPNKWLTFVRASPLVRVLFILLIVGTLIAAVIWMGGDTLEAKLLPGYGTSRGEIWRASWRVVKQNPWTGVGFGTFFLAVPQYQIDPGFAKLEAAHNDYIDLAASGGVVALGLAGWFIAMMIWRTRSALRSRDAYRRAAALGATAGILGIGVHSLVDFGLQVTGISVAFAALVVIAVADRRVESISMSGERKRKSRRTARSLEALSGRQDK